MGRGRRRKRRERSIWKGGVVEKNGKRGKREGERTLKQGNEEEGKVNRMVERDRDRVRQSESESKKNKEREREREGERERETETETETDRDRERERERERSSYTGCASQ